MRQHLGIVARLATVVILAVAVAACGGKKQEPAGGTAAPEKSGAAAPAAERGEQPKASLKLPGASVVVHEDGSVTAESSEGKLEITDKGMTIQGGDKTFTATVGEAAKLPEGFPPDVPQPEGGKLTMASRAAEEGAFTAQWETDKAVADVATFYEKALGDQGWTQDLKMDMPGAEPSHMLNYSKDSRTVNVMITRSGDATHITLNAGKS